MMLMLLLAIGVSGCVGDQDLLHICRMEQPGLAVCKTEALKQRYYFSQEVAYQRLTFNRVPQDARIDLEQAKDVTFISITDTNAAVPCNLIINAAQRLHLSVGDEQVVSCQPISDATSRTEGWTEGQRSQTEGWTEGQRGTVTIPLHMTTQTERTTTAEKEPTAQTQQPDSFYSHFTDDVLWPVFICLIFVIVWLYPNADFILLFIRDHFTYHHHHHRRHHPNHPHPHLHNQPRAEEPGQHIGIQENPLPQPRPRRNRRKPVYLQDYV